MLSMVGTMPWLRVCSALFFFNVTRCWVLMIVEGAGRKRPQEDLACKAPMHGLAWRLCLGDRLTKHVFIGQLILFAGGNCCDLHAS